MLRQWRDVSPSSCLPYCRSPTDMNIRGNSQCSQNRGGGPLSREINIKPLEKNKGKWAQLTPNILKKISSFITKEFTFQVHIWNSHLTTNLTMNQWQLGKFYLKYTILYIKVMFFDTEGESFQCRFLYFLLGETQQTNSWLVSTRITPKEFGLV